uniref:hypothetical protein n=1 Tax=Amycolatopsis sp. CA-151526 TaxID=3239921 RepID=UPI003F4906C1
MSGVTDAVTNNFIDTAAKAFTEAVGKLTSVLLTFWTNIGIPGTLEDPHGPIAFLRNSTSWVAAFVLVISLMIAGAKMAVTHKAEPGVEAAKGVWQMVLYAGAGVPAILLIGVAGDQFSSWILNRATGGDFGTRMTAIYGVGLLNPLGPGLMLIVAIFAILSALGQMALMIVRVGMLTALAGLLPVAAAAAVSRGGKQWLSKITGWLLAWALYKPAAAIVYAAAFALVGDGKDVVSVLSGLFLMVLSILALPALIRLLVPMTAAMAGGAGGGGAAAGIAAGGAVATGAIQMRAMGANNGSGGAGRQRGSSGPSGSDGTAGTMRPGTSPSGPGGSRGGAGASGAGAGAGQAAAKGGAAAGGAGAAAGGPVGAAVAAGTQAAAQGVQAVRGLGERAAGGPTGSEQGGNGA